MYRGKDTYGMRSSLASEDTASSIPGSCLYSRGRSVIFSLSSLNEALKRIMFGYFKPADCCILAKDDIRVATTCLLSPPLLQGKLSFRRSSNTVGQASRENSQPPPSSFFRLWGASGCFPAHPGDPKVTEPPIASMLRQ